jgi:hypothetical protein
MRSSDAVLHLNMPSIYYCRECAEKRKLLYPPPPDPLASQYQVEKYLKHTIRDPAFSVQSVVATRNTQACADYFVAAQAPVAAEVDEKGPSNIIVAAGKTVGVQLNQGQLVGPPQDAVKVVLSSDPWKVHAYPAHSTTFTGAKCSDCNLTVASSSPV